MAKNTPDQDRIAKLRAMKPGMSVFVKGAKQGDMQTLRRLAAEANIAISIYEMPNDSVHHCAGVRIFRMKK